MLWIVLSIVLFFPMFLWVLFGEFILFLLEYKFFHTGYIYNKMGFTLLFSSFWISLAIFGKTLKEKLKMMLLLCLVVPSMMYAFIGLYTNIVSHEYTTTHRVINVEKTMPKELPKGLEKIRTLSPYSSSIAWSYHEESGHFLSIVYINGGDYNSYEISIYETISSKPYKIIIKSDNNYFHPYFSPKGNVVAIVSDGDHNYENPLAQELWIYKWHTQKIKKVLTGSLNGWKHWDYESEQLKPRWLSNHKHIVVGDKDFGYTLIDLETLESKRVTGWNSVFKSRVLDKK
jgi:hypothetical protein